MVVSAGLRHCLGLLGFTVYQAKVLLSDPSELNISSLLLLS